MDFLEPSWVLDDFHGEPSLQVMQFNDSEADPEFLALLNRCRLLLFQAGADPISCQDEKLIGSFVSNVLADGSTVSITTL